MPAKEQQPTFQFGSFDLNLHTRELRKHGVKLRLQQQPYQILTLLLERAGEIVTRDDIQKRLWPDNTYVDFENAINSAVRKLRDALGDSPTHPRYIETLSRQGYRFIEQISELPETQDDTVPFQKPESPAVTHQRVTAAATVFKKVGSVPGTLWLALAVLVAAGLGVKLWTAKPR